MFNLFKKKQYELVETFDMSYEMSSILNNGKSEKRCTICLLATNDNKYRKYTSFPSLPSGAEIPFEMWVNKEITMEQLQDLIKDKAQSSKLEVVPCKESDYYISYGWRNHYANFNEYEDSIMFKLFSDEKIKNENDYAECIFDDILYVRQYRDNTVYFSMDNREWVKASSTDMTKWQDGRFIVLTEELENKYKKTLENKENYATI